MQSENKSGSGGLRVFVQTAGGVLPVEGASGEIFGTDAEGGENGILYVLRSGRDGQTPAVNLPAPPRGLSMSPGDPMPYARYNITVRRDGYGTVQNIGVPVFDGVVSTQPVILVPLDAFETDRPEKIMEMPAGGNPLL